MKRGATERILDPSRGGPLVRIGRGAGFGILAGGRLVIAIGRSGPRRVPSFPRSVRVIRIHFSASAPSCRRPLVFGRLLVVAGGIFRGWLVGLVFIGLLLSHRWLGREKDCRNERVGGENHKRQSQKSNKPSIHAGMSFVRPGPEIMGCRAGPVRFRHSGSTHCGWVHRSLACRGISPAGGGVMIRVRLSPARRNLQWHLAQARRGSGPFSGQKTQLNRCHESDASEEFVGAAGILARRSFQGRKADAGGRFLVGANGQEPKRPTVREIAGSIALRAGDRQEVV